MKVLSDLLDRTVFKRTTMTEIVAAEMSKATIEANQARAVIHAHEFTLHMARARIAALEAWNAQHRDG